MKLHWFINNNNLFESEGDVPLVGQIIYLNDHVNVPPITKRKYIVDRVDRSISLSIKDMRELKLQSTDAMDRYYEAIQIIEKESEGGKVTGVSLPFFKISRDEAQINLIPWSIPKI